MYEFHFLIRKANVCLQQVFTTSLPQTVQVIQGTWTLISFSVSAFNIPAGTKISNILFQWNGVDYTFDNYIDEIFFAPAGNYNMIWIIIY